MQRKTTQHVVCATPVRPMALAGQTDGLYRSVRWEQKMHNKVPGSLSDSSRPCNKNPTSKTLTKGEENPSQN
jgi:hypothetical protein